MFPYIFKFPNSIADKFFKALVELALLYRVTSSRVGFLSAISLLYEEFTDENININSLIDWVESLRSVDLKID